MKKNNKGFTLIELLAVIVILAILVAVAIPSVTKYLNDARKGSMQNEAAELVTAARTYIVANNITKSGNFKFVIGGKTAVWMAEGVDEKDAVEIGNVVQKNLVNSPYGNKYQTAYVRVDRNIETGESTFKLHLSDGVYCFYTDATKETTSSDGKTTTTIDTNKGETGVDESNLNNDMFLLSTTVCTNMSKPANGSATTTTTTTGSN